MAVQVPLVNTCMYAGFLHEDWKNGPKLLFIADLGEPWPSLSLDVCMAAKDIIDQPPERRGSVLD